MRNKSFGIRKNALNGVVQNPVFVLVLGMCPMIKKSVNIQDAFFLGLATMLVLVLSNVALSALRKIVPDRVRLPVYIMIIATFVAPIEIFLRSEVADKLMPGLYDRLGEMVSLISVNCIILGRAETFASKNKVIASAVDGVSMGLGFLSAISLVGAVRQVLTQAGFVIFEQTAGGFLVLGLLMALFNFVYEIAHHSAEKRRNAMPLMHGTEG